MIFYGEFDFFIILSLVIVLCPLFVLCKKKIAAYGLCISIAFLLLLFYKSFEQLVYFAVFLFMETCTAFIFLSLRQKGKKSSYFYAALILSLAPLVLNKIFSLFSLNIMGFMGISYITFKSVQIIIEIHDGVIKKLSFFNYLYFLLFFPSFTSGPIDRSRRFEEDIVTVYKPKEYMMLFSTGLVYILYGIFYKFVLSALFIDFNDTVQLMFNATVKLPHVLSALTQLYFYGFNLFFDFAGYSFMAVGVSYCFGVKLPKNFDKPFISIDIKDFWNRWHMTLSFWLRDFLFTRFVMIATKKKWFKNKLTTACFGYMINMGVMGLWHGLTVNYILYGLYHGVLLSLTDIYQKKSKFYKKYKNNKIYKFASWFVTINFVMIGFGIFSGDLTTILF